MSYEREAKAREELSDLLDQCGQFATAVRLLDGRELLEVLDTVDSARALSADNATTLRAIIVGRVYG
jgi:hypothetical protein